MIIKYWITKLILFVAIFTLQIFGQQFDKTYGKPIIILTEINPWSINIDSDITKFVIYENGQIIYKRNENNSLKNYESKLNKYELEKTISSLSISENFYQLPKSIEASSASDQPETIIYLDINQKKSVKVYGYLVHDDKERKKTPLEFLTLYDNIKKFEDKTAKEWIPKKIEVIFIDDKYALKTKPWLEDFPDFNSSTTVFRDEMYRVYIDRSQFEKLRKFYESIEEKQAVLINGKKMSISLHFPFPNLPLLIK